MRHRVPSHFSWSLHRTVPNLIIPHLVLHPMTVVFAGSSVVKFERSLSRFPPPNACSNVAVSTLLSRFDSRLSTDVMSGF